MKAVAAMMLTLAMMIVAGCKPEEAPNNGGGNSGGNNGNGTINDYEYVDLSLPSGTLWATCNIGANTPEDYGDYFAWGETTPKTTYNWSTYKYCNGGSHQLTMYCYDASFGYHGFTDNLTVLQPSDDAATANWGNGWCMPTTDQWKELRDNTSYVWTTQNGVNGYLFEALNGVSLFLPAAGYRDDNELLGYRGYGYYWLNSLGDDDPDLAWYFNFHSDVIYKNYDSRSLGLSIRPVRSSN